MLNDWLHAHGQTFDRLIVDVVVLKEFLICCGTAPLLKHLILLAQSRALLEVVGVRALRFLHRHSHLLAFLIGLLTFSSQVERALRINGHVEGHVDRGDVLARREHALVAHHRNDLILDPQIGRLAAG